MVKAWRLLDIIPKVMRQPFCERALPGTTLRRARETAVDVKRLSSDEGGIVAGQKRHRADQVGNLFAAFDRLHIGHYIEQRLLGHSSRNLLVLQGAWRAG